MTTYILVHGSWHGAWCWEEVVPLLEKAGHTVITPDLPGHGEDLTPLKTIDFHSYSLCLSRILENVREPVVLVGHSMAGMVITHVAQQYPEKIKHLVYLAAFLPQNDESLFSIAKRQPANHITKAFQIISAENAFIFPLQYMQEFAYNRSPSDLFPKILSRFCVEPLAPSVTPVKVNTLVFEKINRIYIECLDDIAVTIESQRRIHKPYSCTIYTLDCDHSPFYSDPKGLVSILEELK